MAGQLRIVQPQRGLDLKKVLKRRHLLVKDPDDKNVVLAASIEDCMPLVIVTVNAIGDFRALVSHEW